MEIVYCKPATPVKRGLFETYNSRFKYTNRIAKYRSFFYFTKK